MPIGLPPESKTRVIPLAIPRFRGMTARVVMPHHVKAGAPRGEPGGASPTARTGDVGTPALHLRGMA